MRHASHELVGWALLLTTLCMGLGGWLLLQAQLVALNPLHLVLALAVWALVWSGSCAVLMRRRPEAELGLLPPAALLTGWGLLLIARTAPQFLLRQTLWLVMHGAVMLTVALLPSLPRWLRRYRYTVLTLGLLLLLSTLVVGVNPSGYGPRLWLGVGDLYFQPSEALKVLMVIFLAAYLAERREVLGRTREERLRLWPTVVGPMVVMVGLALILLAWQEDLGAMLLFSLTLLALLYLAWGRVWPLVSGLVLLVPVTALSAALFSRVALRVSIWLDPWAEAQADRAYQIRQALFALAAGGLLGEGPGQGAPLFVPVVHTDFPYVALVEEYGLLGAGVVLLLIAWLVVMGLRIAQRAVTLFEGLLAGGLAALLGIQTWIIVGGNVKLIPLTGITFPFLSYGGSSLFMLGVMLGLWLNLSAPHLSPFELNIHIAGFPSIAHTASRLGQGLLLLLFSLWVATGYWAVLRADALNAYPTNPRRVLAEQQLQRGRIVDRTGAVLAISIPGSDGLMQRIYPYPEAASVTGYAHLAYGVSELESACDAALRGGVDQDPWLRLERELTHTQVHGRDVVTTIDIRLQTRAQHLLMGRRGAVVLLDTHSGAVLVLASSPFYDPGRIAETWDTLRTSADAPLFNRATQGLTQPGGALETVLLGLALQHNLDLTLRTDFTHTLTISDTTYVCRETPSPTWAGVLRAQCPLPFVELGSLLGAERLAEGMKTWGLTQAPTFELPTAGREWHPRRDALDLESLGQGELLITPLQLAGVVAVLGNDGMRVPLRLLREAQAGCPAPAGEEQRLLTPDQAAFLRGTWTAWGETIGHLSFAQAGPQRTVSWFLGLNSAQVPRYGVVVMVEDPPTPSHAAWVGQILLRAAAAP